MVGFSCLGRATTYLYLIFLILIIASTCGTGLTWDKRACGAPINNYPAPIALRAAYAPPRVRPTPALAALQPVFSRENDYLIKLAYGKTFGTCTELDYATLEMSRSVRKFRATTLFGPALGEVHVALIGSYVFYHEGRIERIKRLQFEDGFELGWVPKGRFTFLADPDSFSPYLESGAGIGYVSETFRNSGSRFNWSLMAGFGFQKCNGRGSLSVGVQWRHLSNGNMWGKGDELHNSNSGTDMIQGLASIKRKF
jgi:hypothetical protein